jgi:hypothetical protein
VPGETRACPMQCDSTVRRPAASAGWAPSKGTRRPEPARLRRKGQRRCFLAAPGTRDSAASGTGSTLAEIAQIPGERLALASAASRWAAARAGVGASPVARIGESLAGIAEIPGEACERSGLAAGASCPPAARAGAHAAATSLIGESLAGIAEIPGEACEGVGLAAAPRRPPARPGAHASAPYRIGESLAETAGTAETPGAVHPMGETVKLRTAVSIDCLGLRGLRVKRGIERGWRGARQSDDTRTA